MFNNNSNSTINCNNSNQQSTTTIECNNNNRECNYVNAINTNNNAINANGESNAATTTNNNKSNRSNSLSVNKQSSTIGANGVVGVLKIEEKSIAPPLHQITNLQKIYETIQQYKKETPYMTFKGLLTRLFMTHQEYQQLQQSTSSKDQKVYKILTLFRQELEAKFEEILIYQQQDNYNYNSLQFVLKKMNPNDYGDKITTKLENVQSTKDITAKKGELLNISGYTIRKIK